MTAATVVSTVAASAGSAVAAASLVWTVTRARIAEVAGVRERIVALETKVDVFWRSVSVGAAHVLHSPDPAHARRDELLERVMVDALSVAEAAELAEHLEHMRSEPLQPGERLALANMLGWLAARYGISTEGRGE